MKTLLIILLFPLCMLGQSYTAPNSFGGLSMEVPATTTITTPGTFEQLNGTFSTTCDCLGFEALANGDLVYKGIKGGRYVFVGTSDVSADKVCKIQYALFLNGVQDGTTPHDFTAANKSENISITWWIVLKTNDTINIRATSDVVSTTISPSSLNMTFNYVFKY